MKIAYRRNVLFKDHAWWDTATNLFSGCKGFSHTELYFDRINGQSYTSSRPEGPVIREVDYLSHPDFWEFEEIPCTIEEEWIVFFHAQYIRRQAAIEGGKYDDWGIARFVLPFLKQSEKDWFCSETTVDAIQQIGYLPGEEAWRYSPNKLRFTPKTR